MKLECPVRKWRGSFPIVLVGNDLLAEAEDGYVHPVALYCAMQGANPLAGYIIQVMAESSPSPFQKRSTSNVYFPGTLPQPARRYSE
jgi:hypothetical protein